MHCTAHPPAQPQPAQAGAPPQAPRSYARGQDRIGASGSDERLAVLQHLAKHPEGQTPTQVAHGVSLTVADAAYVLLRLRRDRRVVPERHAALGWVWFVPSARERARTTRPVGNAYPL